MSSMWWQVLTTLAVSYLVMKMMVRTCEHRHLKKEQPKQWTAWLRICFLYLVPFSAALYLWYQEILCMLFPKGGKLYLLIPMVILCYWISQKQYEKQARNAEMCGHYLVVLLVVYAAAFLFGGETSQSIATTFYYLSLCVAVLVWGGESGYRVRKSLEPFFTSREWWFIMPLYYILCLGLAISVP
ncbi:MAG: hypothetical protein ACI4CT_01700 [Lachnospiraceae bacterium]